MEEPIWDKTTKHLKRIQPQISVDPSGRIHWIPVYTDYDTSLFYRGKTVTNDEFNDLHLKEAYHSNYISDSLSTLFKDYLDTAIYRSFKTSFDLMPSYTKTFGPDNWGTLQEDGYYYITIPSSEHGFVVDENESVLDKMNIDTEMYLLGSDGRFYEVPQVDVDTNNTVRIYTDDNTLFGFVVIRTNDKAYRLADDVRLDASQVDGLSNVAYTGLYKQLIGLDASDGPETRLNKNEEAISYIISGATEVARATHSDTSDTATRLPASGYIQNIQISDIFESNSRFIKDATTAKNYNTTEGTIKNKFDILTADIARIKSDYYKKTDTVANATNAAYAVNATNATKAVNAEKINNIILQMDPDNIKLLRGAAFVIPQRKQLWSGKKQINNILTDYITLNEPIAIGDKLEVHWGTSDATVQGLVTLQTSCSTILLNTYNTLGRIETPASLGTAGTPGLYSIVFSYNANNPNRCTFYSGVYVQAADTSGAVGGMHPIITAIYKIIE